MNLKNLILSLVILFSSQNITIIYPFAAELYIKIPLMIATQKQDLISMQTLINAGADVNAIYGWDQPHCGKSVLACAIDTHSIDAVKLLLEAGACVETPADIPEKYFHISKALGLRAFPLISYAIIVNAPIEIIELLIQHSKNLNATGPFDKNQKYTCYEIAQYCQNTQAMRLLNHTVEL